MQTWIREVTGWRPREYWFPDIRSLGGAAAMFVVVLYPYVYLLARAAFLEQSTERARSRARLGLSGAGEASFA